MKRYIKMFLLLVLTLTAPVDAGVPRHLRLSPSVTTVG